MHIISVRDFTYQHTSREQLFEHITLHIEEGQKVALIGKNGVGKSTLLRAIAQHAAYAEVEVKGTPYYIPQDLSAWDGCSVSEVLGVEAKLAALHAILDGKTDEELYELLNDDWDIENRIATALDFWDLSDVTPDTPMSLLSGGQKVKVFLSGLLIQQPRLILLDEPTNNLDVYAREKLFRWIDETKATVLLVSHDRKLLQLLSGIYELFADKIVYYPGNYDTYVEQKEQAHEALVRQLENQQGELRRAKRVQQKVTERRQRIDSRGKEKTAKKSLPTIIANARRSSAENTTASMSGKHEEKIAEMTNQIRSLSETIKKSKPLKIELDDSQLHQGKVLVEMVGANFSYNQQWLWNEGLNVSIRSGERVWLKGLNGAGKTTFIKLVVGSLLPTKGIVKTAIFDYLYLDQAYSLINTEKTVYEQAQGYNINMPEHEVKRHLARSLFPAETWDKPCSVLSGGEKMKLSLCLLLISRKIPDMLILDEPTNNLDIDSMEVLSSTVQGYSGTLLVVSHDMYFIEQMQLVKIIELEKQPKE